MISKLSLRSSLFLILCGSAPIGLEFAVSLAVFYGEVRVE